MLQIDADYVARFIVVPVQGNALPEDLSPLRELEADFGAGVRVVWSDVEQSIVAFAFEPALFTPESARAWLTQAREAQKVTAIEAEEAHRQAEQPLAYALAWRLADFDGETPDDNFIWKEILQPGSWFKTDTGRRVDVTPDIPLEAYRAFRDHLLQYVSVPADHHHHATGGIVPPESNRGFVRDLILTPESRLFGGFEILDPVTAQGVRDGTIADCSVFIQPDVAHNETGERYPWVLRHVLLTNNPLLSGMSGWGEKPVSADDGDNANIVVEIYQSNSIAAADAAQPTGGTSMELTEQEIQELQALKALGLSAEAIAAMQSRDAAVRQKVREMEVSAIVHALQGKGEHAGVTQVEGYVHYPVVAQAVEKALQDLPQVLALDADDDGVTGVDTTILSIVNALPQEARLTLEQPRGRKDGDDTQVAANDGDKPKKLTKEQLDQIADEL